MVICLERCADLQMAQLMPLPLTLSCFGKIQIGFIFLVSAYRVVPDKGPLNGFVCVSMHLRDTFCIVMPNFVEVDYTIAETSQFFTFSSEL